MAKRLERRLTEIVKRLFDIFFAALGLLLFSPVMAYLAWRVKKDTPGPALYHGERVGKDGKLFRIHKFRTMYEQPESYQGPRVTSIDDARVTPLGKWLRKTKLNELPQLWNVLKGEMSFVGPRPEDPEVVKTWPDEVRREVLSVKPGITSPASVLYRQEEDLLSQKEVMHTYLEDILPSKLRLDRLYVRHRSFWGDIDILFWTMLALPTSPKTFQPGEKRLFLGPVSSLMRHYAKWFFVDALTTLAAVGITGVFWRSLGPLNIGWWIAISIALVFSITFSLTNVFLNLHRINWERASATEALDLIPGIAIATMFTMAGNALFYRQVFSAIGLIPERAPHPLLPPGMILVAASLAYIGVVGVRYRARLLTGLAKRWIALRGTRTGIRERVLIVGSGETGQYAAWLLSSGRFASAFHVVGFIDDDMFLQGSRISGVHVIGERKDIPRLVKKYDVGLIVFAIHNISPEERAQILGICAQTDARLVLFPDLAATIGGLTQLRPTIEKAPHHEISPGLMQPLSGEGDSRATEYILKNLIAWLVQLEAYATEGDLQQTLSQIRKLRARLENDGHLHSQVEPHHRNVK